jgi:hypothetical protein
MRHLSGDIKRVVATMVAFGVAVVANTSVATPVTSNLVLELRANAGVTQASGLVSAWADQSGQGNHVSQPGVDSLKPQFITGVTNGLATFDVLRFDGTDDLLSRVSPETLNSLATNTSGGSIFVVYRNEQSGYPISYGVNTTNRALLGDTPGTNWSTRVVIGGAGASGSTATVTSAEAGGGGVPLTTSFYAQAAVWNGTTANGLTSKLLLSNGTIVTPRLRVPLYRISFTSVDWDLVQMGQVQPSKGTLLKFSFTTSPCRLNSNLKYSTTLAQLMESCRNPPQCYWACVG